MSDEKTVTYKINDRMSLSFESELTKFGQYIFNAMHMHHWTVQNLASKMEGDYQSNLVSILLVSYLDVVLNKNIAKKIAKAFGVPSKLIYSLHGNVK
jgi:hypothetical protein